MIAKCYKDGKVIKTYHDITRVDANNKYGYFEFYQKIYRHQIIFVRRFNEIDKVNLISKGDFGREIVKEIKPNE